MQDAGVPDEIREAIEEERQLAELQSRIDRLWTLRLEVALARRSPGVVVIVGLLVLALIGLIDVASGTFAVEVLYLLPVGMVTFGRGRTMGLVVGGVAAVTWEAAEIFQGVTSLESSVTYWNGLGRFGTFALIVLLIAPMRQAMVLERDLAERETEAAEQLRAMEELREVALVSGDEETDLIVSEDETTLAVTEAASEEVTPPVTVGEAPAAGEFLEGADVEEGLLDALSDLERDARRERTSDA